MYYKLRTKWVFPTAIPKNEPTKKVGKEETELIKIDYY